MPCPSDAIPAQIVEGLLALEAQFEQHLKQLVAGDGTPGGAARPLDACERAKRRCEELCEDVESAGLELSGTP